MRRSLCDNARKHLAIAALLGAVRVLTIPGHDLQHVSSAADVVVRSRAYRVHVTDERGVVRWCRPLDRPTVKDQRVYLRLRYLAEHDGHARWLAARRRADGILCYDAAVDDG